MWKASRHYGLEFPVHRSCRGYFVFLTPWKEQIISCKLDLRSVNKAKDLSFDKLQTSLCVCAWCVLCARVCRLEF